MLLFIYKNMLLGKNLYLNKCIELKKLKKVFIKVKIIKKYLNLIILELKYQVQIIAFCYPTLFMK